MRSTMYVEEVFELCVMGKPTNAALFDAKSYQETTLYFINKEDAKEYGQKNFPNAERRVSRVIGAEDNGKWTILDPYCTPDLTYLNRINGKLTSLDGIDCATVRTPNRLMFLKAQNETFQLKGRYFFSKPREEVGVRLRQTEHLKDATHFLFTYFNDPDSMVFLNGVLVKPRENAVTLTPGSRDLTVRRTHR